jgi:plasmid replication initiation protein
MNKLLILLLLVGCESAELSKVRQQLDRANASVNSLMVESEANALRAECRSCVVADCVFRSAPEDRRRSCERESRTFCNESCRVEDVGLCVSVVEVCRARDL